MFISDYNSYLVLTSYTFQDLVGIPMNDYYRYQYSTGPGSRSVTVSTVKIYRFEKLIKESSYRNYANY